MKSLFGELSKLRLYHFWLPGSLLWLLVPLYRGRYIDVIWFAIAWALFLFLYVQAHSPRTGIAVTGMAGLCLLAAVYVPHNPAASGILGFCAAALAARNPRILILYGYAAAASLLLLAESLLFHLNPWTWIGGSCGAIFFSTYVLFETRQAEANTKLRQAHEQITHLAKLGERERITRDLHDVVGHTLSLIAMKSELVQKIYEREPERVLSEINDIEKITRQALVRVRETIHGYRNTQFRGELEEVVSSFDSVGVHVDVSVDAIQLSVLQEAVLAMVLQEAATNVMRHAHANRCQVSVFSDGDTVNLVVQDNGRGSERLDGFGIRGMRARLEALGGELRLSSGRGTRLHAKIPR